MPQQGLACHKQGGQKVRIAGKGFWSRRELVAAGHQGPAARRYGAAVTRPGLPCRLCRFGNQPVGQRGAKRGLDRPQDPRQKQGFRPDRPCHISR